MKATLCDICNDHINERDDDWARITTLDNGYGTEHTVDLCMTCVNSRKEHVASIMTLIFKYRGSAV